MSVEQNAEFAELAQAIQKNSGLTTATGVVLLIAGFAAVVSPFVAGLSITIMVGATLAVGGVGQCLVAFKAGAFGRGAPRHRHGP